MANDNDDMPRSGTASTLDSLVRVARTQLHDRATPEEEAAGLRQLRLTLAARRPHVAAFWGWALAAAAGVTLAVWGGSSYWRASRALTYSVQGGTVAEGGFIRTSEGAVATVTFSDGSQVSLGASSRGRVAATHRDGARMTIEDGPAEVAVVHRSGTDWLVDAGPFLIMVTGTEFSVNWSAASEILQVRLHRGAITVRGPLAPAGVALEAGQRLVVHLKKGEVRIDRSEAGDNPPSAGEAEAQAQAEAESTPAADAPDQVGRTTPEPLPTRRPAAAAAAAPAAAAASGSGSSGASWSRLVASGDFQAVVQEAERRGIEHALETGSREDLAALADAARYLRRVGLAERVLAAQRHRFPGSRHAREAAFFLGRLAEDSSTELAVAVDWYDRYLVEAPAGSYASEALGRKMIATEKLRGAGSARAIAQQYLSRFPRGTYAGSARKLLLEERP
jgi:hypothetical protein